MMSPSGRRAEGTGTSHTAFRLVSQSAEGVGFEPTRTVTGPSGFQDRRHRPLGEPSRAANTKVSQRTVSGDHGDGTAAQIQIATALGAVSSPPPVTAGARRIR